jgi:hypothetical protein
MKEYRRGWKKNKNRERNTQRWKILLKGNKNLPREKYTK